MAEITTADVAAQPGERPIIAAIVAASDAMKTAQSVANAITDDLITRILLNPGGVVDLLFDSTVDQTEALAAADDLLDDMILTDLLPDLEPLEAGAEELGVTSGKAINA